MKADIARTVGALTLAFVVFWVVWVIELFIFQKALAAGHVVLPLLAAGYVVWHFLLRKTSRQSA